MKVNFLRFVKLGRAFNMLQNYIKIGKSKTTQGFRKLCHMLIKTFGEKNCW